MDERILDEHEHDDEVSLELSLRPTRLQQYIGQDALKNNLSVLSGRKNEGRSPGSCDTAWSAGARQDDAGEYCAHE